MDTRIDDRLLAQAPDTGIIQNVVYDEIAVGRSAEITRTLTRDDIALFARSSGDVNPAHLDEAYAEATAFGGVIGHGMWTGALFSALLGTELPGPGTIYLSQDLRFRRPVRPGDRVTASVTAVEKDDAKKRITFACRCVNQSGEEVLAGTAVVLAPTERVRRPRVHLAEMQVLTHAGHDALLARCAGLAPVRTAVAHPCDAVSLRGAVEAADAGLIVPILVGPAAAIRAVAAAEGIDAERFEIVDAAHDHDSAAAAVALVRAGRAEALMKGSLHSDVLLGAVVRRETGLRTGRRITHVFVMHPPGRATPLLVTDAAVSMYPTLEEKVDITQNAIDLAHALGLPRPRVAILSAVETLNPKIQSTLDAAALCKMADRGQITGGVLDGPLAFDNAVDAEAARIKGIRSEVAGRADILVVPNFEAGNMVAKELSKLAHADGAGIVLGARCPIILTSRSDDERSRVASCAVAVLVARAQRDA